MQGTPTTPGPSRYEHDDLILRVKELHEELIGLREDLHAIERKVWYMAGSSAAAAAAFTLLAATLVYHVTHGG